MQRLVVDTIRREIREDDNRGDKLIFKENPHIGCADRLSAFCKEGGGVGVHVAFGGERRAQGGRPEGDEKTARR